MEEQQSKLMVASQRALLKHHLLDLQQKLDERPSEAIDLLAYHQEWLQKFIVEYRELGQKYLEAQSVTARSKIYKLCLERDAGISWLFCIMRNAHSGYNAKPQFVKEYLGDQRFDQPEQGGRPKQNECSDQSKQSERPEQSKRPKSSKRANVQQEALRQPIAETLNLAYTNLVEELKNYRWIATDDKPAKRCKCMLECAQFVIDVHKIYGTVPDIKTMQRLYQEHGTASPNRLKHFLGKSAEWLVIAQELLR